LNTSKLKEILVADDSDINLLVLKEYFKELGVTDVSYCINGQ
jgi:CheY-like chemotaxis protein